MNEVIRIFGYRHGLLWGSGFFASIWMFWVTSLGLGVTPDSVAYIEAARSLADGTGLYYEGKPLTHFPPGYPLLLAVADILLPGGTLQVARLLAAFLFGVNFVLFGLAASLSTKGNLAATGCAVCAFLFSPHILTVHSMALSEAPYLTFSLASFLLLASHIKHSRATMLVAAALAAGFAVSTRYVGIVLFPAIVLALLILDDRTVRTKVRDSVIFVVVAAVPLFACLIRNLSVAQSATNRELTFHPVGLGHAKRLILTLSDFILPLALPIFGKIIIGSAALLLFLWASRIVYRNLPSQLKPPPSHLVIPLLCLLYALIYIIFLGVSISWLDAQTQLDHRMLLPVWMAFLIASLALAWSHAETLTRRDVRFGMLSLILLMLLVNARQTAQVAHDIHDNGTGYTSLRWKQSATLAYLNQVNSNTKIYSNGPDVIRFLTGKEAVMIPRKLSPNSRKETKNYKDEIYLMIQECRQGKAIMVYFDQITWRSYLPAREEIEALAQELNTSRLSDGTIYATKLTQRQL